MQARFVGLVGGYLIDDGIIKLEDLDRGLTRQIELAMEGRALRLGEVLVEMGLVTHSQLDCALQRQAGESRRA